MKKSTKGKSSSRRDFLKKSTLGFASAGFLGADFLQDPAKGSQAEDKRLRKTKKRFMQPVGEIGNRKIALIDANDQDEVQWSAPKDSDIAIAFPPGRDPAGVGTTVVKAGQRSKFFIITALTEKSETYKYTVYCYATNEYAHGSGEPELIVP